MVKPWLNRILKEPEIQIRHQPDRIGRVHNIAKGFTSHAGEPTSHPSCEAAGSSALHGKRNASGVRDASGFFDPDSPWAASGFSRAIPCSWSNPLRTRIFS